MCEIITALVSSALRNLRNRNSFKVTESLKISLIASSSSKSKLPIPADLAGN